MLYPSTSVIDYVYCHTGKDMLAASVGAHAVLLQIFTFGTGDSFTISAISTT